jgi:predicted unusual protein kinase regulating ubiquinone biosynthesis (AarF/ABC1/UbiB family)
VHHAYTMEGLSVAVKVQRDAAHKEINGDIRNLKRLVELCDRLGVFLGFDLLNLMREYAVVVSGCWRERERACS